MFLRFSSGLASRARKLEMADRHRRRAQVPSRRPIADILEIKLSELDPTDFAGDSEIYGSLIAFQRFQWTKGIGS